MNRREFLLGLAGLAGSVPLAARGSGSDALGSVLPTRALGRTGEQVTLLGLGGFHIGWTTESLAEATIQAAIEEGVRFFDTAESYGNGVSEERYGKFLTPHYRDQIFLMTKSHATDAAMARQHLDLSRSRMKTDVIDLWQLHALQSSEDVEKRIANGVVDVFLEALDSGIVRHIGFTGHASPAAHARLMETYGPNMPFAACQFPVNPVDASSENSFIEQILPRADAASLGVLAMKTLADGRFFASKTVNDRVTWETTTPIIPEQLTLSECLNFAWSLPVDVLITGAENPAFLREKADACRNFSLLSPDDRSEIIKRVAHYASNGKVEYYKDKPAKQPA